MDSPQGGSSLDQENDQNVDDFDEIDDADDDTDEGNCYLPDPSFCGLNNMS